VNAKIIGIILNGSEIHLKSDSLKELIDSLNLTEARFAIEINREIVPKSQDLARSFLRSSTVNFFDNFFNCGNGQVNTNLS